ncbi:hypothetical protein [Streptomyces sp. LN325]|uniref:hypothetical protein n=1 Tax=Streptomyces sp. LN325 TaxID=3112976 RepID=UPI00371F75C7
MTSRPPGPALTAAPAPALAVLGDADAPRHAVVLAPVMPRWDHGSFFHQVAEPLLTSGHRITVYDTLSLLRDGDDLTALVDRWGRHLAPHADGAYGPSPAPTCWSAMPWAAPSSRPCSRMSGAITPKCC